MDIGGYVRNWLEGAGRRDLARKADRGELPELDSDEARDLFRSFQRGEASPADFLEEVFGIDARPHSDRNPSP